MKIAVFGDLILDHYIIGTSTRLSPEAPVPVVNVCENKYLLGGACNVVRNLRSFNLDVSLFGLLGEDDDGERILSLLKEIKVNTNGIIRSCRETTVKTRVQIGNHQIVRIDKEITSFVDNDIVEEVTNNILPALLHHDLILLSDYSKGFLSDVMIKEILEFANKNRIKVIADPKSADFRRYCGVFFLTPNKIEAELATGIKIIDEYTAIMALERVKKLINSNSSIITLGADGIALDNNGNITISPALTSEVFDVTGAGDTVIAALAYGICNNWSLEKCVIFANKAASIVVRKLGPAIASLDEIEELCNKY